MTRNRMAVLTTSLYGLVILAGAIKATPARSTAASTRGPAIGSADDTPGTPDRSSRHHRPDAIDDRRILAPDRRQLAGR